jgi:hypothetical protein
LHANTARPAVTASHSIVFCNFIQVWEEFASLLRCGMEKRSLAAPFGWCSGTFA